MHASKPTDILRSTIAYLLLGVILLAIYSYSLLPGIGYTEDTVKFQYVGYVLGIPHPPGYPLYMLLSYVVTHLYPFGTLAYRANLLSAVCGVCACLLLMRLVRKVLRVSIRTAFFTALLFGLTPTFWSQAVVAEVYTLMMVFVMAVSYCFLQWNTTRNDKYLYAGALLYGLSFSHHLLMITLLPALVYLVLVTDRSVLYRPRWLFFFTLCILAGLLPYTYLLWRSYADAPFLEVSVKNLRDLIDCITGRKFQSSMFQLIASIIIYLRIPNFIALFAREFHILWPVIFYGFLRGLTSKAHLRWFLCIACAGNIIFSLGYNISDIFVYLLPTYAMIAIAYAAGFESFAGRCAWNGRPYVLNLVWVAITAACLSVGYPLASQRTTVDDARTVRKALAQVAPRSIISTPNYFAAHCFRYYTIGYRLQQKQQILTTNQYIPPESLYAYLREDTPIAIYELSHGYRIEPGFNFYFTTCVKTTHQDSIQAGDHFIKATKNALMRIDDFFGQYGIAVVPQMIRKCHVSYEKHNRSTAEYQAYLDQLEELGLHVSKVSECLYKIE